MKPYRYNRLENPGEGLGSFRLLTLFRGAFDDDICVAIDARSLPRTSQNREPEIDVKWFALSYTWGDLQDRSTVVVRSGDASEAKETYVSVTKSLIDALQNIRCDHAERYLWVDAICIDQGDDDEALQERAWQVQCMHQIYAQATGVIIWLGGEADDSTFALESLHRLGSSVHVDWKTFEIYTQKGEASESMEDWHDRQRSLRDRKAVANLLERPWFDRVWIRQEAFFAREDTSGIFCGDAIVSFAEFRRAIHYLSIIGMDNPRQNVRLALALSICQREFSDTTNLLRRIRASECKDPRDRVYGILGILSRTREPGRVSPIRVDYSISNSAEQVYKDYFVRYVGQYGTLGLLDEAGLWQDSEMRPSWIPDWRPNVYEFQLDLKLESATSHFLKGECSFLEEKVLRVLGRHAEQVAKVHTVESPMAEQLDSDSWKELAMLMFRNLGSVDVETAIERFTRALCCVLNPIMTGMSDMERRIDEITEYVTYLHGEARNLSKDDAYVLKPPKEIISDRAAAGLEQCVRYLRTKGASLLFSAGSHVGIGPRNAKADDQIWAILGSRALMLLREVYKGRYEIVGPCFVHGFNWGEALLGPLPDHYTVIDRFEKTRDGYVPYYLNTETGSASMWDPRVTWEELEAHPPMANFVPVTSPPGEPFRVRPDSAYLQRHGIKVQQIDLV